MTKPPIALHPWPWPLKAYRLVMQVLTPVAPLLLRARMRRGKEHPERIVERRGFATQPRPGGRLVWLHGASVGETVSMLPLVDRLIATGLCVLVTSGTMNSARVMAQRLPHGAVHAFMPLDAPAFVGRFLDHWRPDLAAFAESELWPVTIAAVGDRGIPLVLVNARLSERSMRRWLKAKPVIAAILGRFDAVLAQSPQDRDRLETCGAGNVVSGGNLKFDAEAPPYDPDELDALERAIAGRTTLLAASTHPGEEAIVLDAHAILAGRTPGLLTVIVPRHPERGDAVAALAAARGLGVAQRSTIRLPAAGQSIHVADTIGELGLFLRAADAVVMGGSLVPHGGQNPIEPALLGKAVVHGPHVRNFADIYAMLDEARAALPVAADAGDVADAVQRLIDDARLPEESAIDRGTLARNLIERSRGGTILAFDTIMTLLRDKQP